MPLYVIATPIGNSGDLSPRAAEKLRTAQVVIGEEWKELKKLIRQVKHEETSGETEQKHFILNEHSKKEDLEELIALCESHEVALVSDCGTPAFCDPGSDLVRACHEKNIAVRSLPGPSSLSTFISLCGVRLDQFLFRGFIPARGDDRERALKELKGEKRPILLMDTPYRLQKLLEDLKTHLPERRVVLGLNLSMEDEVILRGRPAEVLKKLKVEKAEFMLLVEATNR